MPTLHNPTENKLFSHILHRILEPFEHVEITDEQAEKLRGNAIFVVHDGDVESSRAAAAESDSETGEAEDGEAEQSSAPQRKTATRGSKRAEVNDAPDTEKRG